MTRLDRFISQCRTHEAEWCSPQSAVLRALRRVHGRACGRACASRAPRNNAIGSVSNERLNNLRRLPPGLQGSPWTVRQTKRAPKSARDAGMGTADTRAAPARRAIRRRGARARLVRLDPSFWVSCAGLCRAGKKTSRRVRENAATITLQSREAASHSVSHSRKITTRTLAR